MKIVAVTIAVATLAVSVPAFAQSGPRVEATVGWDRVVFHGDNDSAGKSGVTYGGEAGYDFQAGIGMIIGAYAGIDGASTKDCLTGGTEQACLEAGRNITAGVRVGGQLGLNSLVYLKGGYSNGRIQGSYTDSAAPSNNFNIGESKDGFHAGAGIQTGLGHGLYGKAEYVYTRYSSDNIGGYDLRIDRHRILAGVGFHF